MSEFEITRGVMTEVDRYRGPYRRRKRIGDTYIDRDMIRHWLAQAEERQDENSWAKKFIEAVSFLMNEVEQP